MDNKAKYKTKQREDLMDYLAEMPGEHITVSDVCEYFRSKGKAIGQTTVYRQLDHLVDEGLVNKYVIDINSPACYEYMAPDSHVDGGICFHLKCERCGKLIHLHCEELDELPRHMKAEHNFVMDPRRTVIYGLCEDCAGK